MPFINKQDKSDDEPKDKPFSEASKDEKKHNPGFTKEEKAVEENMFIENLEKMK